MMTQVLTIIAGVLAVIIPGILFSIVLFPEKNRMDFQTRMASGIGLGLLLTSWISYILARHHRLILSQFLIAMGIVGGILFLLAFLRGGIKIPRISFRRKIGEPQKPYSGEEGGEELQVQTGDSGQG